MAKLSDQKISNTFKDLLHLDNSNSGITASGETVKDGDGTSSCLGLGTNKFTITPGSNSTANVVMNNASGDGLLKVDGVNKLVKVNETQLAANTQYLRFFGHDIDVLAGSHQLVSVGGHSPNTAKTLGTGTDPAVPTLSNDADDYIHYLHYVDTNITVDAVSVLSGANGASGDTINFHLVSLGTTDTVIVDEFTSCTVVADNASTINAGYEQFYKNALDIQSADVDAGSYLAFTIESSGTNSDYSVNALVRYHLR